MRRWHRALSALCLALLVLVRPGIDAAPPQTSPQLVVPENASVDELLSIADKLWSEAKGNTAFPLYERALAGAEQRGLELQQAQAHHGIARVLNYRTQYATARDHALKAAEIYERLGNTQLFGRISVLLSGIEEVSGTGRRRIQHNRGSQGPGLRDAAVHSRCRQRSRRRAAALCECAR
jgi:hypothetical protein